MSSSRSDTYIVMAVSIGVVAIVSNLLQTAQILENLTLDGLTVTAILGGIFGQASIALAMICAIIVGRHVLANRLLAGAAAIQGNDALGHALDDSYREPTDD